MINQKVMRQVKVNRKDFFAENFEKVRIKMADAKLQVGMNVTLYHSPSHPANVKPTGH